MPDPTERKTILVVDDTPEVLTVLNSLLNHTYRIKIAANGKKALRIALSDAPPDLILLDIMMPEMDGFEVCRRLKADRAGKIIPIIFLTAKTAPEDEAMGFDLGAVDYVTKPVNPHRLTARIRTHLALSEGEKKLRKSKADLTQKTEILKSVFESMSQGVVAFDGGLKLIAWNQNFRDVRDYPQEFLEDGRDFADFMHYDVERGEFGEGDSEEIVNEKVALARKFLAHQFERQRPDGRFIEVRGQPLPDGGFVSTYSDITERKIAERNLALALRLISESIQYSSRIQRSVLPDRGVLEHALADHFIIWEPKDVVGGDIYLHRTCEDGFLLMVIDCTGHGVPGALMTMIVTGALDQALADVPDGNPASLLERINQLVKGVLGQDSDMGEADDGLEIGLCRIEGTGTTLTFAGARFELWQVDGDGLTVIKGDKPGLGYRHCQMTQTFTNHPIEIDDSRSFYMTSDGMIDQIGGEKRRSFGKRRLQAALLENADLPLADQARAVQDAFSSFQGSEPRRDDVTLMGFKPRA